MFNGVKGGGSIEASLVSVCCPAGKYKNQLGGAAEDACTDCAVGKYNDEKGSPDYTACTDCAAGKYNDEKGSTAEAACTHCAAGKYNNLEGQTACTDCAPGTSSTPGASDIADCKNWNGIKNDILADNQAILQALASRQSTC